MGKPAQLLFLVAVCCAMFFLSLGATSLYQVAEARNAECAREMMERKDWVVPVFNGRLRTDKPALEYFFMMIAYHLGGVSEGSARFFSAVCGLLLIIATFLFASRHLGTRAAWWTALALLASPHLIFQFRLATPDPYLILATTLALYAFYEGWCAYDFPGGRGRWWYASMYFLLGVAFLAKGPVGVLLPAVTILVFLLAKRQFRWRRIRQLGPWWGIPVMAAVAAPWYILVDARTHGAWTSGFFFEHNLQRFGGSMGGHGGIFLVTFLFVAVGMLPFSILFIGGARDIWRERKRQDLVLFSLIALATVVIFYAVSRTKLINYTVPCYPFLALMTGWWIERLTGEGSFVRRARIPLLAVGVIASLFPVAAYVWTRTQPILRPMGWIALVVLIYPAGCWTAYRMTAGGRSARSLVTLAVTFMTGTLALLVGPYPALDRLTPVRKAQQTLYPHRPVAAFGSFNNAFVFYARHPISELPDTAAVRRFLTVHPDGLILSRDRAPGILGQMAGLQEIRRDPEIFNSHPSRIFGLQEPPRRREPTP